MEPVESTVGHSSRFTRTTDESLIGIHSRVGWRRIAGDVVSYDCRSHVVAIWNEAASILWDEISKGPQTIGALITALVREYGIGEWQAAADARSFCESLSQLGLSGNAEAPKSSVAPAIGGSVLSDLERRAIRARVPFTVLYETTYRCNERCIHCFADETSSELPLDEIEQVLADLAAAGCLFLTLTGGEFFVRRDALEIVETAARLRFVTDILTNGTLIDRSVATALAQSPIRRVQVSLYGSTAALHDSVTRRAGSFRDTLRGINASREAGLTVEITMPLLRANVHDAVATSRFAKGLGCGFIPSPLISARNSGATDTHAMRLSDGEIAAFLRDPDLAALYRGRRPFEEHQHYMGVTDLRCAPPCYSGFATCSIRPNGEVTPCNQLLLRVGDLGSTPFREVWEKSPVLNRLRSTTVRDLPVCSACELLPLCSRCPGLALLEGGDLHGVSPENCRTARIRARLNDGMTIFPVTGARSKEVVDEAKA